MLCRFALMIALATVGLLPLSVQAQNSFSTAIKVNGSAITFYELDQRTKMLALLRVSGNPQELAREQLIDDRLRLQAAQANGIRPRREEIDEGMTEFAGRADLPRDEFVQILNANGVDEGTFRDFVRAGLSWRMVVRQRFGRRAQPSESEVDRVLSNSGGTSNIRVLISEIIIPAPPGQAQQVMARATEISRTRSVAEFSRAAREYSATATRHAGGKLPWQNLGDLPPALQPIIPGLAPGEVTEPLQIPNAVALFQLHGIEEGKYASPTFAAIEYAAYYIPGGRSDAAISEARKVSRHSDTCDDLYGVNRGQPDERLERNSLPPAQIPTDIAFELSKLDPGETSYALSRADGQTLVLLMLCGRSASVPQDDGPVEEGMQSPREEEITLGLRNRRLTTLADSYLEQLRADARISE